MANRFPLIVNLTGQRLEELTSGDSLNLTENGIIANNTLGINGQYLKTNGTTVVWDNPGDVYLNATQTLINKTLSGSNNTFSNIPNNALVNSSITINGTAIPLGGSVNTLIYTTSLTSGLTLSGTTISIKNVSNLTGSQLIKWDSINNQLTNSNIQDNGTTVTITGNFKIGQTSLIQSGSVNITMPSTTGTLIASGDTGTVSNIMLAGNIGVEKLSISNGKILIGNNSNIGSAIELTGDATVTNTGTLTISANAITFAKFQQSASAGLSVIGRRTNSIGNFAEISAVTDGHILRLSGTTLEFGQIVGAGITNNTITLNKLQQSSATGLSVIGRSANTAGNFTEIIAGTDGHVLRLSGTTLAFGQISTAGIADNAVNYSKFQNISGTDKLLGRSSSGAGIIEEITCTAAGRALIDDADATTQRSTLGLGTIATQNSNNVSITGGSISNISNLTTTIANLNQITETVVNAFNTTLSPSAGTLTIDTSTGTIILGDLDNPVTKWTFTNVPTTLGKATTITAIIKGDGAQTYGDACSVNGSDITGGVKWSGGTAPTATNNFDIITFTIVRDSAGTINVFGSGNTNFS